MHARYAAITRAWLPALYALCIAFLVAVGIIFSLPGRANGADASNRASVCNQARDALAVVVVCNGTLGSDFRLSSGKQRLFRLDPSLHVAWLRGEALKAGDSVTVTGTASAGTSLLAVFVTHSGSVIAARFEKLGLEGGGHDLLTFTKRADLRTVRLKRGDGSVEAPSRVAATANSRAVSDLVVRRRGAQLAVDFVAAGTSAEVALLDRTAAEELLTSGELEDPFLLVRTIPTAIGAPAHVLLPSRPRARYVYVKPLGRSVVLPAIAAIP
jgi:hypothetical protein